MWLQWSAHRVGATGAGRLLLSTFSALDTSRLDSGPVLENTMDTAQSNSVTGVLSSLASLPTIRVPLNLTNGQQEQLFMMTGRYQLDPTGASSTHPAMDTFRRITTQYVFDTYGSGNIVEIGPALTRMASKPALCAAHSCSPTLDGRDVARALEAMHRVGQNHPNRADLISRGTGIWSNPQWMCGQRGQDCQVPGNVLFASFSLQESTPADLVAMMDAHNTPLALVSLSLPIALDYVNVFHEVDTGCRWVREGDNATCFPGGSDAGYRQSLLYLRSWSSGFDVPLFAEIVFQYGSSFLFRFSRNTTTVDSSNYPIIFRSLMEKYTFIGSTSAACSDFLTSAAHYERLVNYLSMNHDKLNDSLFKAALQRISVLTPAIVLGSAKHTDRWGLTLDERVSVAMCAVSDVQKIVARSGNAQVVLDAEATKINTAARRDLAALEPSLFNRFTAALRGESSIRSDYSALDALSDFLDGGRSCAVLLSTGALPPITIVGNGTAAPPGVVSLPIGRPVDDPNPPVITPRGGRAPQAPSRGVYPAVNPWHPKHDLVWLNALPGLPGQRNAHLFAPFDPLLNHQVATLALGGLPVNNLTTLQRNAVANWSWGPQTRIDLLLVGPAGSNKSTTARRIAPAGTVVVVPTNELQLAWERAMPQATVLTHDRAVADVRLLRTAAAIIIDELYQMPTGHVITMCSLDVPVIAIGCPGQRNYVGPLGAAASHTNIPVDHCVVMEEVHRYGPDVLAIVNNHVLNRYNDFALPVGFAFRTTNANPCIQQVGVERPGMHLVCHVANLTVFPGAITVDASQGTEHDNVYLHLFPGDEAFLRVNPYALSLAASRCRQTFTITLPPRAPQALINSVRRFGLRYVLRGATVFGHWTDLDGLHPVTDFHGVDPAEPSLPVGHPFTLTSPFMTNHPFIPSVLQDAPVEAEFPQDLPEALQILHPFPPNPAVLTDEQDVIFRAPDKRVHGSFPEWTATQPFVEPTLYSHIGYPFNNSEQLPAIYAIFDRYLKPQNCSVRGARALALVDFMFDNWMHAFIRPEAHVVMPPFEALCASWCSKRNIANLTLLAQNFTECDTSNLVTALYFLKSQAKPKFGAYGQVIECGQGILATNKGMNVRFCPPLVAAVKTMQSRHKSHVIYDSGYTNDELDAAVRATGVDLTRGCLSIDLSQQDSSHIDVHRAFICKVLAFLGFGPEVMGLYLIWRSRRVVKGQSLRMLFEVLERLFSGEPGTAFFNYLHSTGTTASSHDLSKILLFLGKGDDNSMIPAAPWRVAAINVVRETGVIQKCARLPYLDFANRIWSTSGRSFPDPCRLISKWTSRLTGRENTVEEHLAMVDQGFTPDYQQLEEICFAVCHKHKIDALTARTFAHAAIAIRDYDVYVAHLSPHKRPISSFPVLRRIGDHEVIFEDLEDRCGPAAVAFLSGRPLSEVLGRLSAMRNTTGRSPAIVRMDLRSPHPHPAFCSSDEFVALCRFFQISHLKPRSGARFFFHRGHVSVCRDYDGPSGFNSCLFGARQARLFSSRMVFHAPLPISDPHTLLRRLIYLSSAFFSLVLLVRVRILYGVGPRISTLLVLSTLPVFSFLSLYFHCLARRPKENPEPSPRTQRFFGSISSDVRTQGASRLARTFTNFFLVLWLIGYCTIVFDRWSDLMLLFTDGYTIIEDTLFPVLPLLATVAFGSYLYIVLRMQLAAILIQRFFPNSRLARYLNWFLSSWQWFFFKLLWVASQALIFLLSLSPSGRARSHKTEYRDGQLLARWLHMHPEFANCFVVPRDHADQKRLWRICHPDKLRSAFTDSCHQELAKRMYQRPSGVVPSECLTTKTVGSTTAAPSSTPISVQRNPTMTTLSRFFTTTMAFPTMTQGFPDFRRPGEVSNTLTSRLLPGLVALLVTLVVGLVVFFILFRVHRYTLRNRSLPRAPVPTPLLCYVCPRYTLPQLCFGCHVWFDPTLVHVRRSYVMRYFVLPLLRMPFFLKPVFQWRIRLTDLTLVLRQAAFQAGLDPRPFHIPSILPGTSTTTGLVVHSRSRDYIFSLLARILRCPPLAEQVTACQLMFDVADCVLHKPALDRAINGPTGYLASPSQLALYSRVCSRVFGTFSLIIAGNAGCSKTTLYLALATVFDVTVVVPSNELRDDVEARALALGLELNVVTQHAIFDQLDVARTVLLVDEVWLLPEWHIRAIAALSERCIAFGDPYQTNDLGFGQSSQSVFVPLASERWVELPTSFTVPRDAMDLAIALKLVPDHYRTLSPVRVSIYRLTGAARFNCPVVSASRECKAGFSTEHAYTIVTIQGARVENLVAHCCGRDLTVLAADGTFSSGVNRSKLLWTMLSRHSRRLYVDFSDAFYASFGHIPIPVLSTDNEDVEYLEEPLFRVRQLNEGYSIGFSFSSFTPVLIQRLSSTSIVISNRRMRVVRTVPYPVPAFADFVALDPILVPTSFGRLTFIIERCPSGGF